MRQRKKRLFKDKHSQRNLIRSAEKRAMQSGKANKEVETHVGREQEINMRNHLVKGIHESKKRTGCDPMASLPIFNCMEASSDRALQV